MELSQEEVFVLLGRKEAEIFSLRRALTAATRDHQCPTAQCVRACCVLEPEDD